MPRKFTSLDEKITNNSTWDENHLHLLWHGAHHRGQPTIRDDNKRHLHPVRHLLNLDHPRLMAKRQCLHEDCINPDHYDVRIRADPFFEQPAPEWLDPRQNSFSPAELGDIDYGLELLAAGHSFSDEEFEFIPQHLIEEVKRRCSQR